MDNNASQRIQATATIEMGSEGGSTDVAEPLSIGVSEEMSDIHVSRKKRSAKRAAEEGGVALPGKGTQRRKRQQLQPHQGLQ